MIGSSVTRSGAPPDSAGRGWWTATTRSSGACVAQPQPCETTLTFFFGSQPDGVTDCHGTDFRSVISFGLNRCCGGALTESATLEAPALLSAALLVVQNARLTASVAMHVTMRVFMAVVSSRGTNRFNCSSSAS